MRFMVFGQYVKQRRAELGMTQVGLAQRLGVSKQAVSQMETTRHVFPPRIPAVAKALEVQPEELNRFVITGKPPRDNMDDASRDILGIKARIRRRRMELGLSQRTAAKLMGLGHRGYCYHEDRTMIHKFHPGSLKRIAEAFGVTVDYLLGGNATTHSMKEN